MHRVEQHRCGLAGIEAVTLLTDHAFPRHAHDAFGIGMMTTGAQRSWSGIGWVEARVGDLITTNPGEMHDGAPLGGPRGWRILYIEPAQVADAFGDLCDRSVEIARPVLRDPALAVAAPAVRVARERLDDAPHLPATLAALATLAGTGRFQLLRGFARDVGTTPHAYLVQRRVRLARSLLAAGRTVAQAAQEAGFADQSHLTRAFRRQLGVTPARYRAAVR